MYSHIIYEVSDLIFGIFDQMTLDLLDISITNLIVKIMVVASPSMMISYALISMANHVSYRC